MGRMANGTRAGCHGVAAMSLPESLGFRFMAGDAELRQRFDQQVLLSRTMGIMTGLTAFLFNHTMNNLAGKRVLFVALETDVIANR